MDGHYAAIHMFAGNFAPRNWALCNGQILAISQNPALFSLLGTTYGGDGRTTFALPDLRGRLAIGEGSGPGLPSYRLGERGGQEKVLLSPNEMPTHSHTVSVKVIGRDGSADSSDPFGAFLGNTPNNAYKAAGAKVDMAPAAISGLSASAGGGQEHPNIQPFQCVNFIICTVGIFPSRS